MKNRGFGISNMFFFMGIFIILLIVVSLIVHNMHLDDRDRDNFFEILNNEI